MVEGTQLFNFGKNDVEAILEELREKGQYQQRQEILRTIKEQDKELVGYEVQMIGTGAMVISALIGYIARKTTAKLLERYFGDSS